MVADGLSAQKIRHYLHRWVMWWAMTSDTWGYQELLQRFIEVCWHTPAAQYAAGLYHLRLTLSDNFSFPVAVGVVVA